MSNFKLEAQKNGENQLGYSLTSMGVLAPKHIFPIYQMIPINTQCRRQLGEIFMEFVFS
jgi:hypothetical protein